MIKKVGQGGLCEEQIQKAAGLNWDFRNCPVCDANTARTLFHDRNRREGYEVETDLVECSVCGMRYLNPVPKANDWMDKYEVGHKAPNASLKGKSVPGHFIAYILDQWRDRLWARDMRFHYAPLGSGDGKRILDIGCGKGDKLKEFSRRGFQACGVDVSETAISEARQKVAGDFKVGSFESADYPAEYFDVIRFDNVLEHIYDPRAFLQKVFILLRPGGEAYGYVPNGDSPSIRWMGKFSVNSWVPFHLNLFTRETLLRVANEAGFNARVIPIENPNWAALSVYQWMNRKQKQFDFNNGFWMIKVMGALVAPILWALKRIGTGEEIYMKAIRPIA